MMITPDAVLNAVDLALAAYLALRELECATDPFSPLPLARLAGEAAVRLLPGVAAQDSRLLWARMIERREVRETYAHWVRAELAPDPSAGVRHAAA